MPCRVTTNCALCGQEMDGQYPQDLASAVQALLNAHRDLAACHLELEQNIEADHEWKKRHDLVVEQRNQLKNRVLDLRQGGNMTTEEHRSDALKHTPTQVLLEEVARRVSDG